MSPLLAPIFAQLISLQVGDRTETRYVKQNDGRIEGYTAPAAVLRLTDPRTSFTLGYTPSLSLIPLERKPRELYVFHSVSANASYKLFRSTTLSLNNSLGIGSVNFRLLGVQGQQATNVGDVAPNTGAPATGAPATGTPTTGTPTTGTPTTGTPGVVTANGVIRPDVIDQKVQYYTFSSGLGLVQQITKAWTVSALGATTIASGRGAESRRLYPPLRGWSVGGATGYAYPLNARDTFFSNLALVKTWSSNDNEVATLNGTETWTHRFAVRTSGSVSAGLNITRFSQADGLRGLSIFPAFTLAVSHQARVGRGTVSMAASAFSSPTLDPLRALVDPRVGVAASVGYARGKLGLYATGSTTSSVAPAGHDEGAVSAYSGDLRAVYQVGKLMLVDAGGRVVRQTYQQDEVIPITWVAYVGVTFGYTVQLVGSRKK